MGNGLGDRPEDAKYWWRLLQNLPQVLRKTIIGDADEPLRATLLRFAETYTMSPQNAVPAFARPFKVTTTPDGVLLPKAAGPGTYATGLQYQTPPGYAAVITAIHHELESPGAYNDVNIRLFYQGSSAQNWYPHKPEVIPVTVVLWHEEKLDIQYENTSIIMDHYLWAEILGFEYAVYRPDKSQQGLRARTK